MSEPHCVGYTAEINNNNIIVSTLCRFHYGRTARVLAIDVDGVCGIV